MNIKCAIFDFDGTLFDSMFIWNSIAQNYLISMGKNPKPQLLNDINTLTLTDAAEYLKNEYLPDASPAEILNGINKTAEKLYMTKVKPKKGAENFLRRLKNLGINMAIATASDRKIVEKVLEKWDMAKYFEEIFTCEEMGCGKEFPVIYKKSAENLKAKKENTIVFEDALFAAKTAAKEGFLTVGVFDESEKNQTELKKICNCYIKNFENCPAFWKYIKT